MSLLKQLCTDPQPFAADPTICGGCGHQMAEHKTSIPQPGSIRAEYLAKLAAVFIEHGGVHDYHGTGIHPWKTQQVREHMATCAIDLAQTREPEMDFHGEFTDTFSPSNQVEYLTMRLVCACGKYSGWGEDLILPEVNMAQLIWYVTQGTGS